MVYIPFASLLGFGAALEPLVLKQPTPLADCASLAGVPYTDPKIGGGSLLDHDTGSGLGEPLNVSLFFFLFPSPALVRQTSPLPHDEFPPLDLELVN
jgi:hypothetical protein